MRILRVSTMVLVAACVASSASAQEPKTAVQAFGGLGLGRVATTNTNFGGAITGSLTPNIQLVGEAGRIGNVLPSMTQTLIGLSPVGFSVPAWYGEGGVRFTSGSGAMRPYAEATAGIARLQPQLNGVSSGLPGAIANVGLSLLDRTAPLAGVGGGVTFQGGAFVADVGYRHRRVFSDSWIQALALGDRLSTNEVRVGFGFRF